MARGVGPHSGETGLKGCVRSNPALLYLAEGVSSELNPLSIELNPLSRELKGGKLGGLIPCNSNISDKHYRQTIQEVTIKQRKLILDNKKCLQAISLTLVGNSTYLLKK